MVGYLTIWIGACSRDRYNGDAYFDDYSTEEDGEDAIDSTDSKLDLARAYIEMGDTDGARALLAEIVSIGSHAQKIEAKELLLRIDTKSV